ncbi:MAG TPA: serine hydrolase [Panacibacter sp.]|nr:serine hydrolase [Panacibacter sp.]
MKRILTILLFVTTTVSFAQKKNKPAEDKRFAGLDTAFARVLKDWHAAGFAVAVVEKDKVVYSKGFGYKDYENKVPVTPNTLFAIGSCTKAFTASVIGMLQKEDKVDIDKPVRDYVPQLKFYNDDMNAHITLRDMMCHRTGLPRHDYSWYYFSTASKDSIMQRIQYMEPTAGLREKWQYNNFMFMMQGAVAEKLTGKTWEQNVQQRIFDSLGMNSSVLGLKDWMNSSDKAFGYDVQKDSIIHRTDYYNIGSMAPAGSINSSVNDMAKWVTTWIYGGKYNGKEILPPGYVKDAMSSQMVIAGGVPTAEKPDIQFANYGFGWFLASYKSHYRVEHGGNIDGFSASTCFFPTDSIGIIVLCNQNGSTVPSIVRNLIADRMLGLKYFDWNTDMKNAADKGKAAAKEAEKTATENLKKDTRPTHALKDYEGLYNNKGYGTLEVTAKDDSLFAYVGSHIWWLKHYTYDAFEPVEKNKEGIFDTSEKSDPMQFQMTAAGDIKTLLINFEPGLKPLEFNKTPKPKEITKDSLQKYVGEYELSGATVTTYIKGDKTLYVVVPGQPDYELVPVDKNKFELKVVTGYFVQFSVNDKNEVTDLSFIQPNGTFKATKKK